MGCVVAHFTTKAATGQYVLQQCVGDTNVSPLWCVHTTDDDREANMVWQKMVVQHLSGVDYVGTEVPLAKSKLETQEADVVREATVHIPILINSKPLTRGQREAAKGKARTETNFGHRRHEASEAAYAVEAQRP